MRENKFSFFRPACFLWERFVLISCHIFEGGRLQKTLKAHDKSPDDSRISLATSSVYEECKKMQGGRRSPEFSRDTALTAEMGVAVPYLRQE